MANTPATPASVASRLTDEEIENIAASLEHDAENLYGDNTRSFMADENNAAAVLRDYVRLRKRGEVMASKYETETSEKLKGKTIKQAKVTGHGVDIVFEDGTVLEYHASDGGYSCWTVKMKER